MHFSYSTPFIVALAVTACLAEDNVNKRKCLDTSRHKAQPSPEKSLFKTCNIYESSSCCTNHTAMRIHGSDLYNFTRALCKNNELSRDCRDYFLRDACFFECSPELGSYISEDGRDVKNVPLCQSDCEDWFAACSNEFTCTTNWKEALENEKASCKSGDKCQTIKDKFKSATNFCEKVWGGSYVVSEEPGCLKINLATKQDVDTQSADGKHINNSGSSVYFNVVILLPIFALMSYLFR